MGQYNQDMKAYRAILNREMHLAHMVETPFWSQFIGFIGSEGRYPKSVALGSNRTKLLRPTGKPIEVLTNFEHEGGVTMDIPVVYPLTEPMIYGDKQLLGTEESRKIAYKTVRINQVRKGIKVRDGKMSEQVLKKPEVQKELMTTASIELRDINTRWNGFGVYDAFLRGFSDNLTSTVADGGLGVTAKSHPNFYVMGSGKAAWNDNPVTYESNVATALATLTDASTDYFSTRTIEAAVFYASKHKIQPMKFGSQQFYCMVISPAQAIQLWSDQKWLNAQSERIKAEGDKSPLFTGIIEGVYRGVLIYVDQNAPGTKVTGDTGYDSSRGVVNYGNKNPLENPIDESPRKLAILFGKSAIACGYASALKFEQETWDYGNKKTEGSHMIVGYERSDIYDSDGDFGVSGNFKENTSSMVIATYSPENVSWA